MSRYTYVNPRKTGVHGHHLDPKAVAYYENNPNGRYQGGGGHVIAQRDRNGKIHILNGSHRRQAAINKGRKLQVELFEHDEKLPSYESGGGCALLIIAGLGTLTTLAWGIREMLPI